MKKTVLNEEIARMRKMMGLNENNGPFNDGGEPTMTHQQYRDYSEPSEPDYDDDYHDQPHNFSPVEWLRDELKDNGIFLENYGNSKEYSISCKGNCDFGIYFDNPNDEETGVEIYIYVGESNEPIEQKFNDINEALNYILSVKDKYEFEDYQSAVRSYVQAQNNDMRDRYNSRAEMGGYGLGENADSPTDSVDGVEVIREIDGVKFVDFSNLCDVMAKRNGIDRMDWERMDDIEELAIKWIKKNNAYLHTFWSENKYGAYLDGLQKAKEEGKDIVVLEYNS